MKKAVSIGKWVFLIAGVSYFLANVLIASSAKEITFRGYETDTLQVKIEELKNKVLDDLRACESGGASEDAGLIIYDSNKVASIGSWQWQVKSVQHYYKVLHQQEITGKEAILIALDESKARQLAKDVIFTTSNVTKDWLNCSIKKDLKSKVAVIKELEK